MIRRIGLAVWIAMIWVWASPASAMESGPAPNLMHGLDRLAQQEQTALEQRGVVLREASLTQYLQAVAGHLWKQVRTDLDPPEIIVIADTRIQAFAYPNGFCYLTTGMLSRLANEDQLAMIISHELVHYAHQDSAELYRYVQTTSFDKAMQSSHWFPATQKVIRREIDAAEHRADAEGLSILKKSGYCEQEAISLMLDLAKILQNQAPPEFSSYLETRTRFIEAQLDQAHDQFACTPTTDSGPESYLHKIAPALIVNAQAALQSGNWDQADTSISRFLTMKPDSARANYLKGEILRRRNDDTGREQCMGYYEKALKNDPDFALAYRALGELYFKAGRYDAAKPYFETFLSLAPQDDARKYIEGYLDRCSITKP